MSEDWKWGSTSKEALGRRFSGRRSSESKSSERGTCLLRPGNMHDESVQDARSRANNGVSGQVEVKKETGGLSARGFTGHYKIFGCYSEWDGMLLGDFEQESDKILFTLCKAHSGCWVENMLCRGERNKCGSSCKNPGERHWWLRLGSWQWRWQEMVRCLGMWGQERLIFFLRWEIW